TVSNTEYFGGSLGIFGIPLTTTLTTAFIGLVLSSLAAAYVSSGRLGVAVRAAGQDPLVAKALGVSVNRIHLIIGSVSSAIAAAAASLYVGYVGYIDPLQFGFHFTIMLVLMVIIGGRKSWIGAIL